jgi:hypothetical protein
MGWILSAGVIKYLCVRDKYIVLVGLGVGLGVRILRIVGVRIDESLGEITDAASSSCLTGWYSVEGTDVVSVTTCPPAWSVITRIININTLMIKMTT